MISDDIKKVIIPHLGDKLAQAQAVLFTGAGFTHDCRNFGGEKIPTGWELREPLWNLCFETTVPDDSTLPDIYASAELLQPTKTTELLTKALSVDPSTIPDYYATVFSAPWAAAYTINIDNLADACATKFRLPRHLHSISATTDAGLLIDSSIPDNQLEVIHLNGTLGDLPHNVTFSPLQYGQRATEHDAWYATLVAQLLSQVTVFIGTKLDEGPFWQYVQLRRLRGSRTRELRPRSYLITPTLDAAKQVLLRQLNILWIPATAEDFTSEILVPLAAECQKGLAQVTRHSARVKKIPDVGSLAISPSAPSEFLLGSQPIWSDIQSGRAIERDCDKDLEESAVQALAEPEHGVLLVTGTAGSGKSTSLMRLGLRLTALGYKTGWIDEDSDLSPHDIRGAARSADAPQVLIIDDADLYGHDAQRLAIDVAGATTKRLVVLGIRSGRADRIIGEGGIRATSFKEWSAPPLSDNDIGGLIEVLDRNNRLGELKGLLSAQRHAVFARLAGRQLLVAMITATSGDNHTVRPIQELDELTPTARHIYAAICVVSSFRFSLSKPQIMAAIGDGSNATLNLLDSLVSRHIVVGKPDGTVRARHRMIADIVRDELQKTGELKSVLDGIAFVAATSVRPNTPRSDKTWRLLRAVINHSFVARTISSQAQEFYVPLENILHWDYHYWLQRGTYEVKFGSLALAENFLGQAKGLASDDSFVLTEWAYMRFRKAIENPASANSTTWVEEAVEILEEMISSRGTWDHYPYHVLGQQGLLWSQRGMLDPTQKRTFLANVLGHLRRAASIFPSSMEIDRTLQEVRREYLSMAVK